jgi:hypothetical protein
MTKIVLPLLVVCGAMLLGAATATASSPPASTKTVKVADQRFQDEGTNCTNGLQTILKGVFTGVIRTTAREDGTTHTRTTGGGTTTLYDHKPDGTPGDGKPDATSTYRSNAVDVVFGNAAEQHRFELRGTTTALASGIKSRFFYVYAISIGADGTVKSLRERLHCN